MAAAAAARNGVLWWLLVSKEEEAGAESARWLVDRAAGRDLRSAKNLSVVWLLELRDEYAPGADVTGPVLAFLASPCVDKTLKEPLRDFDVGSGEDGGSGTIAADLGFGIPMSLVAASEDD